MFSQHGSLVQTIATIIVHMPTAGWQLAYGGLPSRPRNGVLCRGLRRLLVRACTCASGSASGVALEEAWRAGDRGALFLIAPLGASAVLVFGAPLADFSQPRNLIGGHMLSAIVGVTTHLAWPHHMVWASAIAVSSAIVAMHLTRTLHPPGGATALIAVIGSEPIKSLGYWYVLSPVLTGAVILLLMALIVNNFSSNPRRHYPVYWF